MHSKGSVSVSQWDKLIEAILHEDAALRFEDLCKALERMGYTSRQPRKGSSHYTFRKPGCMPITIPKKHGSLKRAYIELVSDAVKAYLKEDNIE